MYKAVNTESKYMLVAQFADGSYQHKIIASENDVTAVLNTNLKGSVSHYLAEIPANVFDPFLSKNDRVRIVRRDSFDNACAVSEKEYRVEDLIQKIEQTDDWDEIIVEDRDAEADYPVDFTAAECLVSLAESLGIESFADGDTYGDIMNFVMDHIVD